MTLVHIAIIFSLSTATRRILHGWTGKPRVVLGWADYLHRVAPTGRVRHRRGGGGDKVEPAWVERSEGGSPSWSWRRDSARGTVTPPPRHGSWGRTRDTCCLTSSLFLCVTQLWPQPWTSACPTGACSSSPSACKRSPSNPLELTKPESNPPPPIYIFQVHHDQDLCGALHPLLLRSFQT